MQARFITLEGGEGVGKSTQARLLTQALRDRGHEVLLTREPGGTSGAEAIRALLLDPSGAGWGARAEALLFAAARADHVERAIAPALAAGQWVVCDRFVESSRAYQGGEGTLTDADILDLHRIGSNGLLPNLTLLLEADPAVAARRLLARDGAASDRIAARDAAYHERVARRFARMAQHEPARFVRIGADGSPEDVHRAVLAAVDAHLEAQK